ncbi:MAG: hypothetical protein JW828_10525 [Sedimentisphaerales bacterium]|nr:hypothetical protein [Sedimentisphaerales bacterium]
MMCLWYRWKISDAVNGETRLSESIQRHLQRCVACRRFYRHSMDLAEGLQTDSIAPGTLAVLHQRIMSAIEAPQSRNQAYHRRYFGPAIAAAAGFLLVGISVILVLALAKPEPTVNPTDPVRYLKEVFAEVSPVRTKGRSLTVTGLIADPYSRELTRLTREAESGVKFVVSCIGIDLQDRTLIPAPVQSASPSNPQ